MSNVVYILKDPRILGPQSIRYVGKSEQGTQRLKEHLKPSSLKKGTHKDNWIKQLLAEGLQPEIEIIQTCKSPEELFQAEAKWYQYYKHLGCPLTNLTDCGKGTTGYTHTPETIETLKQKALARDKAPYQNPHNKKKNIVIDGELFRNCTKCKLNQPIANFSLKIKDKTYQGYCKPCALQYERDYRIKKPRPVLSQEEFNASRKNGASAGGKALAANPEARAKISAKRSKSIQGTHTITGEIVTFPSALAAKAAGFQNSNIGQAIKYNRPYKGYIWTFI